MPDSGSHAVLAGLSSTLVLTVLLAALPDRALAADTQVTVFQPAMQPAPPPKVQPTPPPKLQPVVPPKVPSTLAPAAGGKGTIRRCQDAEDAEGEGEGEERLHGGDQGQDR